MPLESNVAHIIDLVGLVVLPLDLDSPVDVRANDLRVKFPSRKILLLGDNRLRLYIPLRAIELAVVIVSDLRQRPLNRTLMLSHN